jgi:digeranylgeranylglycerophospholipid reductase
MSRYMHDVVVIGAGPTGCYAASQLSKEGFDVFVLDKNNSFEHQPVCTGIIGLEAFERFKLPKDSILSSFKDILFFSPSGLKLAFKPESTPAYVVDRIKFDQGLRDLALKNGANIKLGISCKKIKIEKTQVNISISTGENIKAKAVIVATGFNRSLSESFGMGSPSGYVQGAQTEVKMEGVEEARVYVGNDISPGSFAWIVGLGNGLVRIGLTAKNRAPVLLKKFLEGIHLKDKINGENTILSKIIPVGSLRKTYSDRMLVIGEAAGLVKTTTHGGIYYGLISSQLAAETLTEAFREGNLDSCSMRKYEKQWKNIFDREIKTGYMIRRFFSYLTDEQIDRLFKITLSNGVMDIVYKKLRFDWHCDLVVSLARHVPIKQYFPKYLIHRCLY